MTAEACAAIVARDDPRLYKTALFAPEPARSRLMVLYAFDIELSRATQASKESLIPRMRLQWWRDVVADAAAGEAPKEHEVAGPLASLVAGFGGEHNLIHLSDLIDAHEKSLEPMAHENWLSLWSVMRFGGRRSLAINLLDPPGSGSLIFCMGASAQAEGIAFVLRHAARMAAATGRTWIEGIEAEAAARLARGDLTDHARDRISALSRDGLEQLKWSAESFAAEPRAHLPAVLPLFYAERTLRLVARDPAAILGDLDDIDRPFDGLRLAWRAARGRW